MCYLGFKVLIWLVALESFYSQLGRNKTFTLPWLCLWKEQQKGYAARWPYYELLPRTSLVSGHPPLRLNINKQNSNLNIRIKSFSKNEAVRSSHKNSQVVGRIKAHNSNSGPIPKRIELRTIEDPMKLEILEILCTSRERGGGGGGEMRWRKPRTTNNQREIPRKWTYLPRLKIHQSASIGGRRRKSWPNRLN